MKPSEAIAQGKCPSCLGIGWVHRVVPMEHEGPCSTCLGTGLWPPDEVQLIDGQAGDYGVNSSQNEGTT